MKVSYFREMKEHHMVVTSGERQCPEYQLKMIQRNPIPRLLVPVIRQMNGEILYDYLITGCQSLQTVTELEPISKALLEALIDDLNRVVEELDEYLVDGHYLSLRPEFIYLEKGVGESIHLKYCFFPFQEETFEEQVRELLKYVLNEVDYQEKDAVNLAYELFQQTTQEGFLVRQLSHIVKAMEPEQRTEKRTEDHEDTQVLIRESEESGSGQPALPEVLWAGQVQKPEKRKREADRKKFWGQARISKQRWESILPGHSK